MLFEDVPSITSTQDSADIDLLNVLDTETYDIKSLKQDAYSWSIVVISGTVHTYVLFQRSQLYFKIKPTVWEIYTRCILQMHTEHITYILSQKQIHH